MLARPSQILGKRSYYGSSGSSKKKRRTKVIRRIPRTIQTRGTPQGYYEIPVTVLTRLYFNTSTGFWQTDQNSGAQGGLTGYNGMNWSTTLDNTIINLGNGTSSTTITQAIPGFSSLQAAFDLVKIAKVFVEVEFVNPLHNTALSNAGGVYINMAVDPNDFNPPASESDIMQYSNLKTLTNGNYGKLRFSFIPYIIDSVADYNGNTIQAGNQPAGYVRTSFPAATFKGFIGWISTFLLSSSTAQNGYLVIKTTQIRRFKLNK